MEPLVVVSQILGWLYTIAWSSSFYGQFLLNLKRKSIIGVSIDFLYLNVLGFLCYSVFNIVSLTSETVRDEYRFRHDGKNPLVRWNDVAFAVHATLISSLTVFQALVYKREINQKISLFNRIFLYLALGSILIGILLANSIKVQFEWLDLIYLLSYIKLYITVTKYIPQAYLNYKRKSTMGWSIVNILLDLTGGVLSFAQLFLDSYIANDFSVFSNPGKLGLSLISIVFDLLFVLQHFVLYKNLEPLIIVENDLDEEEEEELLIDERSSLIR